MSRGNGKGKPVVRLMLDSGAYSAYWLGKTIDIDAYIKFIKDHAHLIDTYVNLDVIPGIPGQPYTQKEVEASAKKSYENLQYMKSKGLHPIPVFHQGERIYWLEKLLGDGEPYIGLSTNKTLFTNEHRRWLDHMFTVITNKEGEPLVDTHGFGVTSFPMLFRYPWTTCDSTTWSIMAGYGKVVIPPYVNGEFVYDRAPNGVIMSGVLNKNKATQKLQFDFLGPKEQEIVRLYLKEVGVSVAQARHDDGARRRVTLYYFLKLSESGGVKRFLHRRHGLHA